MSPDFEGEKNRHMEFYKPDKSDEYKCLQMIQDMIIGYIDLKDFLYAYPLLVNEIENKAKIKELDVPGLRSCFQK